MSELGSVFPIPLVNLLDKVLEFIQALALVKMHQLVLDSFSMALYAIQ
jgi:hypothetical protein